MIRWMCIHTNWACSVCVWEWAVKKDSPVAVYIWLVCVICARLHCEDECRWLWLCVFTELAKILHDLPQRHISCMCTHYHKSIISYIGFYFKGKFLYLSTWVLILCLFIMTIDQDNNWLTDSPLDIWEHRFQQKQCWSDGKCDPIAALQKTSNEQKSLQIVLFESDWSRSTSCPLETEQPQTQEDSLCQ